MYRHVQNNSISGSLLINSIPLCTCCVRDDRYSSRDRERKKERKKEEREREDRLNMQYNKMSQLTQQNVSK
jgi:hypothetical protein